MAKRVGLKRLTLLLGLALSLVERASVLGRLVLSPKSGRDFDGVFPCPCGWNACQSPMSQGLEAGESYSFSSTCYLPSTHEGSLEPISSAIGGDHSGRNSSAAESSRGYCSLSQQHSLCRYSPKQAAPSCGQVLAMGVDQGARAEALRVHNELRAKVAGGGEQRGRPGPQPPAADMMMLEWDEELANTAQAWANQCVFEHDCGDCRRTNRFVVGQNLYLSGGTGGNSFPDWRKALTAFYDEVQLMSPDQVQAFSGAGGVGHYTQLVWGSTLFVGCGYIQYKDSSFTQSYYACNYGSAGNYVGQPIYQAGPACSKCPAKTSCSTQYPGLCTAGSGGVATEWPGSGGGEGIGGPGSGGGGGGGTGSGGEGTGGPGSGGGGGGTEGPGSGGGGGGGTGSGGEGTGGPGSGGGGEGTGGPGSGGGGEGTGGPGSGGGGEGTEGPGSGGGGGPGSGGGGTGGPGSGGGSTGGDSRPSPCGIYDECEMVYESRAPAGGKFVVLHCQ